MANQGRQEQDREAAGGNPRGPKEPKGNPRGPNGQKDGTEGIQREPGGTKVPKGGKPKGIRREGTLTGKWRKPYSLHVCCAILSHKTKDAIHDVFLLRNIASHAISSISELTKYALLGQQCMMKEALPCSSLIIKTHEWNQHVRNHRVANTPRHLGQERSNLQHVATLAEVSKGISAGELLITTSTNAWIKHANASHDERAVSEGGATS